MAAERSRAGAVPEHEARRDAATVETHAPAPGTTAAHALHLQRAAGNRAVTHLVQRKSAPPKKPSKADAASAELLAMTLEWVLDGQATETEIAPLTAVQKEFAIALSQAITGRNFGGKKARIGPEQRESEWEKAGKLKPAVVPALSRHKAGIALLPRLDKAMAMPVQEIVHDAMLVRAKRAGALATAMASPKMKQARIGALAALKGAEAVYGKINGFVEDSVGSAGHDKASGALKQAWEGYQTVKKLVEATDPATYRSAMSGAAKWYGEGKRTNFEAAVKAVEVEAGFVDLTVGTLHKVASLMNNSALMVIGRTSNVEHVIKQLQTLEKAGEAIRATTKTAVALGKLAQHLAKLGNVLNGIQIVGGIAKAINADSTFDRIDAGVDVASGGLSLGGAIAGSTAMAAGGTAVGLTWGMVKVIGNEVAGAIEGSQYGGLWEELRAIEERGVAVVSALGALDTALDEKAKRADTDPGAIAGADEATGDLARTLAKAMLELDKRWQNSSIRALQKFAPVPLRQEIMNAQQDAYPPDLTSSAGHELVQLVAGAAKQADVIVVDMLVEAGYFTAAKAAKVKAKLARGG